MGTSISERGLAVSSIAILTACASGITAMVMLGSSNGVYDSVSSDIDTAQLKIERELLSQGENAHNKEIKDLGINFTTSHGDTTLQVSGTFKDGYCIVGTNPENERSEKGVLYSYSSDGTISEEDNDCTENLSLSDNVAGPAIDQNEINDTDPVEVATATFMYTAIGGFGGLILSGFISMAENKKKRKTDGSDDDVSSDEVIMEMIESVPEGTSVIVDRPAISNTEKSAEDKMKSFMKRLDKVKSEWAEYELDLVKVLEYPAVTDMNVPATFEFHKSMRKANHFLSDSGSITEGEVKEFGEVVFDVEHRFEVMLIEAKRLKWNDYSEKERVSLQMAQSLLSIAINSASSPHERQIAYKRLMKEVEGILVLPKDAILELEARVSLAIETAPVKEVTTV